MYDAAKDLIECKEIFDGPFGAICLAIAQELWTFEWRESTFDITLNENGFPVLEGHVWVHNNEDPDDEKPHPLTFKTPIHPFRDPRSQIRDAIHGWLCHEADEQMWFNGVRVFHPHNERI